MKTKVLIVLFMLFVSFFAKAEKTYRRDHDICKYQNQTIDLDMRTHEQYSVSEDDEYGEIVFIKQNNKVTRVDLRDMGMGRYRMLKFYNDLCPKILTVPYNKDELAFFFMKDNRPFADLMLVLYYNLKTQEFETIETKLPIKTALFKDKKVFFKISKKETDIKVGSTLIDGQKYTYIEKPLEPWVSFDGKNFKLDEDLTIENFEYKNLIKKSDLKNIDFAKAKYAIAVNPELKKKCISFKQAEWACH